jgi:hypothetical protein
MISGGIYAQTTITPTYPGTTWKDYSKPSIVIDKDEIYQTYPGTTWKDYSKPGYKIEKSYSGTTIYETYPGTSWKDYSKPAYKVEEKKSFILPDYQLDEDPYPVPSYDDYLIY